MACNNCKNCPNMIIASSVTTSGGITTITIPSGTTFRNRICYCIGIFTTIPSGTNGTQVNITDGTTTWTIYNKIANYWRPCCGLCNGTLKVKFFNDPVHFLKV